MIIAACANIHLDKKGGEERLKKVHDKIGDPCDILVYCGDISTKEEDFGPVLDILAKSPARTKLYVAGNRDLLSLNQPETSILNYTDELQTRLQSRGIILLDKGSYNVDGVGFIGHCGWYDGSLFQVPPTYKNSTVYPPTLPQALKIMNMEYENNVPASLRQGIPLEQIFDQSLDVLQRQLEKYAMHASVQKIVLALHHVPSRKFVKYGESEEYDYWNLFMGSDAYAPLFNSPKVALGFTAQTARVEHHRLGDTMVYNVSTKMDNPLHYFCDRNDDGTETFNFQLLKKNQDK